MTGNTEAAGQVLKRAVVLDKENKYPESLICYQEGIQLLLDAMRNSSEEKRKKLRTKISEYMDRAEVIKATVEEIKANGTYHEQIKIENNGVGFSYDRLFGRFLDENVETVDIDDPYIRTIHQIYNFLRFCELLVKKCPHLKRVQLITGQEQDNDQYKQHEKLQELALSLADEGVKLIVQYSETIHDREIRLNTGWIIKLGRGLDIYKAAPGKFSLGYCDYELRKCHETTVDIFHQKGMKKSVAFVE